MSNYMNLQRYKNGDWVKCVMFVGHEQHPHKTVFIWLGFYFAEHEVLIWRKSKKLKCLRYLRSYIPL